MLVRGFLRWDAHRRRDAGLCPTTVTFSLGAADWGALIFSLFNVVLLPTSLAMRQLLPKLRKLSVLGLSLSLNKTRSKTSTGLSGKGREPRLHCAYSCPVKSSSNCPSKSSLSLEVLRTRSHLPLKTKHTSYPSQQSPCCPEQQLQYSIPSLMRDLSDTQTLMTLSKQWCKKSISQFVTQVVHLFPRKMAIKGKGQVRFLGITFRPELSSANGWSQELTPLLPPVKLQPHTWA